MSSEHGHAANDVTGSILGQASHDSGVPHPDVPIEGPHAQELRQDGNPPSLPRFLEDQNIGKHWNSVPYIVRKSGRSAARWARGPPNPVVFRIQPVFPTVQHLPILLLDRYFPRRTQRLWLLAGYFFLWSLTFALVKRQESALTELQQWGKPEEIGCGNAFWARNNLCDLNGNGCRPFEGSGFAFRCPANCAAYQMSEPRAVGAQQINYRPLVVGGPANGTDTQGAYRADSYICGSAIHAGVISDAEGGCGVVKLVGQRPNYMGTLRHGIESIGFDSYFPKSYHFEESVQCKARDMRWPLLVVSVVFTTVLSLFTTSPPVFFFTIFTAVFWHVGLVSDPPNHSSFRELFTIIVGKYLPVMFVAWVMYDKMAVRRTLVGLTAQFEKTILWLGACWVGALDNHTLGRHIPISRLNAHDIHQQPGAVLALTTIVSIVSCVVLQQIWAFRQEARLLAYGKLYLVLLGGVLLCLLLSPWDLHLRLHHYALALLLLAGTSVQTRPALLYQGLLVGLFANGIARWGWAPVVQTASALRGDGQLGSALPVLAAAPRVVRTGHRLAGLTFRWAAPPERNPRLDGISLLVNDVERFRGYFDDEGFAQRVFTWERGAETELKEYFRFAYISGTRSLDYTKAGVWNGNLEWEPMQPGASSVDRGLVLSALTMVD